MYVYVGGGAARLKGYKQAMITTKVYPMYQMCSFVFTHMCLVIPLLGSVCFVFVGYG
jgi:hypothetical protein